MFNEITRMVLQSKRDHKERQQGGDNAIKLGRPIGKKKKRSCC